MIENPYESPQSQVPLVRRRTPSVLRMMFSGLVTGTLVGLGAGAVAGAVLFVSLWVTASAYSASDPISVAEVGAMQVFQGVFTGAIVGFVFVAPLGVLIGLVAALWQPLSRRAFVILTAFLLAAVFAAVGAFVPLWPSPISALVTGMVGIGGGIMLGRVLAELAYTDLNRVK